jgi:hypothetical protein
VCQAAPNWVFINFIPGLSYELLPTCMYYTIYFYPDILCADRRKRLAPPATPSCPATCWPTSPLPNLSFLARFFLVL